MFYNGNGTFSFGTYVSTVMNHCEVSVIVSVLCLMHLLHVLVFMHFCTGDQVM